LLPIENHAKVVQAMKDGKNVREVPGAMSMDEIWDFNYTSEKTRKHLYDAKPV
jgi:hypothetical protein